MIETLIILLIMAIFVVAMMYAMSKMAELKYEKQDGDEIFIVPIVWMNPLILGLPASDAEMERLKRWLKQNDKKERTLGSWVIVDSTIVETEEHNANDFLPGVRGCIKVAWRKETCYT